MRFLAQRIRAFGSVAEQKNDFSFLMSLLERPKERLTIMTPEKWPNIRVESRVLRVPDEPGAPLDKCAANQPSPAALENPNLIRISIQDEVDERGERRCSGEISLDGLLERKFSPTHDPCEGIEKIRNVLSTLKGYGAPDTTNTPTKERYIAFVDKMHFGDLQSKTISMLMSKALGYNMNEPIDDPLFKPREALINDMNGQELDCGKQQEERTAFKPVEIVLVLSGADLHLVEFGQLERLAALYGVECAGLSRSRIERSLCKYFNLIIKEGQSFDRVSILETLDRSASAIRKRKCTLEGGQARGWSVGKDELLMQKTEQVRDARKSIVERVEEYLLRHDVPVREGVKHDESISIWEVVADDFPEFTTKACKKRWMNLHRLRCMENPADI